MPDHGGGALDRLFAAGPTPQLLLRKAGDWLLRANPAACALLGYATEALADVPARQLIPYAVAELLPLLHRVEGEGQATGRLTACNRDGAYRLLNVELVRIDGAEDPLIHAVVRDLTREQALEEDEGRYRSLLSSFPDLVFHKDAFGVYQDCNRAFEQYLGRSRAEIIGHTDYDLLPADQAASCRADDRRVLEYDGLLHHEKWVRYPDGREALQDIIKAQAMGADGRPSGLIGVGRDVTERYRAEQQVVEEERRYRHMLATAEEGFWLGDYQTLETVDINDSFCHMLGYSREELLGQTPADWMDAEERVRFQEQANRRYQQEHRRYELNFTTKDGRKVPVLANATTFRDENGEPKYAFAFVNDISQLKQTQQELARLADIIEATPEIVGLADRDLNLVYQNRAAQALFGPLPAEGATVTANHPAGSARRIREEGLPTAAREGVWIGETVALAHDGRQVPLLQTLVAHYDDQGEVERYSTIAHDLTDQKRAEQRENRYREQLDHYGRLISMGELVSLLSHQLSQPLTASTNFASAAQRILATKGPQSPEIPDLLDKLVAHTQQAGDILANVRGYMKGEGPSFRAVDLNALIQELAPYLESSALGEGEGLVLELAADMAPVRADPFQIQELLTNLVKNAAESNRLRQADGPLPVVVATRAVAGGGEISVRDAGVGLPEAMSPSNPEPFFTTKEKGLGLGLWIANSILESHKGRLEAKPNADGPGATFRAVLPAADAEGET